MTIDSLTDVSNLSLVVLTRILINTHSLVLT